MKKLLLPAFFIIALLNVCRDIPQSSSAPSYTQKLFADPSVIDDAALRLTRQTDTLDKEIREFERGIRLNNPEDIEYRRYLRVLFAYRDPELAPLYKKIIQDTQIHLFFKLMAVSVLGESAGPEGFLYLLNLWPAAGNNMLREYVACAMGKLADSSDTTTLSALCKREQDLYVRKTLEAALKRARGGRGTRFAYLPAFDTTGICKLARFPDARILKMGLSVRKRIKKGISGTTVVRDCIYPHMQYKLCEPLYDKVGYPLNSFGFVTIGCGQHVGEDSGWLFAGMPVHAIMDGLVVMIQHEASWGCLVCIESRLPDSQAVTACYGHLSAQIDVVVGQELHMGDKIGEIGQSFTLENGGYLSHLHLGIEKGSFEQAIIAGYHDDIDRWHDPAPFIREFGLNK